MRLSRLIMEGMSRSPKCMRFVLIYSLVLAMGYGTIFVVDPYVVLYVPYPSLVQTVSILGWLTLVTAIQLYQIRLKWSSVTSAELLLWGVSLAMLGEIWLFSYKLIVMAVGLDVQVVNHLLPAWYQGISFLRAMWETLVYGVIFSLSIVCVLRFRNVLALTAVLFSLFLLYDLGVVTVLRRLL